MEKNNTKNKSGNKVIEVLKSRKNELCYLLIGILVGVLVMGIFWPKRIAKLANGEEVIVEIKGHKFTADDLYKEMKSIYGTNDALFNLVDLTILKNKYPDLDEEATKEAEKNMADIYDTYLNYYGYTKEEFLSGNGFKDESDFLNYLKNQYYYEHYYIDYIKSGITDKDIEDYYKKHVFGEKSVYVFTSAKKDDLETVRKNLKANKSFKKIKEANSNGNSYTFDSITFRDIDTLSQTILDKIASTAKGKYSKVFEDDVYGYVVVYVLEETDAEKLEDIKDELIDMMVKEKQQSSEILYYQAFINLRKEYEMKIHDADLKKSYEEIISQFK